ncbi:hypothetical protein MMC10_006105 [Thelotrema lepadinum]|nr:hypothetical protein [Thelotrema lepadinum]
MATRTMPNRSTFLTLPTEVRRLIYSFDNEPLTLYSHTTKVTGNGKHIKYHCEAYLARDTSRPRSLSPALLVTLPMVCKKLQLEIQHEFGDALDAEHIIGESILYFPNVFEMRQFGERKESLMALVKRMRVCIDGWDCLKLLGPEELKVYGLHELMVAEYFHGGPRAQGGDYQRFAAYLEEGKIPERSRFRKEKKKEEEGEEEEREEE